MRFHKEEEKMERRWKKMEKMEEEEKMKGKRKCLSRAAVIIVTARMPLKCFCRLDCTSSQWNGKKEKGKKYNLTAEAKENEGAEEKGNLLWLQWSPSNPGWHWHFPRTQAPCPWHPFTQPSVNSCKSWLSYWITEWRVHESVMRGRMPMALVRQLLPNPFTQHENRMKKECEGVTWEFWGTRTTLCSSPSSLYTETNQWPSSMKKLGRRRTSFCNRWQLIWNRKGELSKFLHLKVVESVKLGLSCFDVLSLQIFPKLAYIARDYIFPEIVLKSF